MPATTIPANEAGYTASSQPAVRARLVVDPEIQDPSLFTDLMRVSVIYPTPVIDLTNGHPTSDKLFASSEIIDAWGRPAIYINGRDVSRFRGAPTAINTVTWSKYGNFETAEITLPNITTFDNIGSGSLAWLTESAPLRIVKVTSENLHTAKPILWSGFINAIRPADSGIGVTVSAHGILLDGTYRLAKPSVRSKRGAAVDDIGHDIAAALNATRGRWQACRPTTTGVKSVKDGAWEDTTSYVQSLLSLAIPDADPVTNIVTGWTVWCSSHGVPSIIKTANIPDRKTITLLAGQDGVQDSLSKDTLVGVTAIYGTGTTKGGAQWRNTKYPMASATKPRFPLDDPDGVFGQDTTDAMVIGHWNGSTTIGGVTTLETRLAALGHTVTVNGIYDATTAKAVAAQQKKWGLKETGIVNAKFWSKMLGQRDCTAGAWIAPLYILPETRPRNYNDYGKDIGPNASYKKSTRKLEKYVDFGDAVTINQAARAATAIVKRDGARPVEGDLTLTVCPPECARWDIRPGDVINYRKKWGANLTLLVHSVAWSLSDLSVRLTVSTRDMDNSQLNAELNRLKAKNPAGSGVGAGLPAAATGLSNTAPVTSSASATSGGGGIVGVITKSASFILSTDQENKLIILSGTGTITCPGDTAAFPIGAQVHLMQTGAGSANWTIQGVSGVSVYSFNGLKVAGDKAATTLIKVSATEWLAVGALTT